MRRNNRDSNSAKWLDTWWSIPWVDLQIYYISKFPIICLSVNSKCQSLHDNCQIAFLSISTIQPVTVCWIYLTVAYPYLFAPLFAIHV